MARDVCGLTSWEYVTKPDMRPRLYSDWTVAVQDCGGMLSKYSYGKVHYVDVEQSVTEYSCTVLDGKDVELSHDKATVVIAIAMLDGVLEAVKNGCQEYIEIREDHEDEIVVSVVKTRGHVFLMNKNRWLDVGPETKATFNAFDAILVVAADCASNETPRQWQQVVYGPPKIAPQLKVNLASADHNFRNMKRPRVVIDPAVIAANNAPHTEVNEHIWYDKHDNTMIYVSHT